jgi:3-oxoacyl-[acyl-carrier protein] reductase
MNQADVQGAGAGTPSTRFSGRVIVVIGAGRGIGAAIARRFAREDATVVVGDRDLDLAQDVVRQMNRPAKSIASACDIGTPLGAQSIVGATLERFGRLDVIVQNAAIYPWNLIGDISIEEWDDVLGVNLRSAFLTARAALEPMKQQGGGKIIYTSSITGPRVTSPGHAHYASSKAGIGGFIKSAAIEFAPFGITVNGVEPGNIVTEGLLAGRTPEFIEGMRASVPLGRLGTPEDVAGSVAFLASNDANYITGTTIIIDGGQTLPESKS